MAQIVGPLCGKGKCINVLTLGDASAAAAPPTCCSRTYVTEGGSLVPFLIKLVKQRLMLPG